LARDLNRAPGICSEDAISQAISQPRPSSVWPVGITREVRRLCSGERVEVADGYDSLLAVSTLGAAGLVAFGSIPVSRTRVIAVQSYYLAHQIIPCSTYAALCWLPALAPRSIYPCSCALRCRRTAAQPCCSSCWMCRSQPHSPSLVWWVASAARPASMHTAQRGTVEPRSSGVLIVWPAGRSQGSTR
jgi:hypothetical protein